MQVDLGFVAEVISWTEHSEPDAAEMSNDDDQAVDFASLDLVVEALTAMRLPHLEDNEFKSVDTEL